MPSRAYTSFLRRRSIWFGQDQSPCQCPLGLIPHFYANDPDGWDMLEDDVSMPSRAYTSFLLSVAYGYKIIGALLCQCPLGLIPHFYNEEVKVIVPIREVSMPSRAYTSFLPILKPMILLCQKVCQCPLGLIPHFYGENINYEDVKNVCVNALSGLYLISTLWYKGK